MRALRAARNHAWRRWRHAVAVAARLGVLYANARPSAAAVEAWQSIAAAVAECAGLEVTGARWDEELRTAGARMAELSPPGVEPTRPA